MHYYKESVLTTWETSFSAVQARSPNAANLFLLVCWLNPNDVFEELFDGVFIPPDKMDYREANTLKQFQSTLWLTKESIDMRSVSTCFRYLQDYSLVRWEPTQCSYRIHTLVQAWAQDRLDSKSQKEFITLAVALIIVAVYLKPRDHRLRERLVSHMDHVSHTIFGRLASQDVDTALLDCLHEVGDLFLDIGRNPLVKTVRHFEAEISSSLYEELDPRCLKAKSNLARSLTYCGFFREAHDLYEETLDLQSQVLGEDHEDSLYSLSRLAELFLPSGNDEVAVKLQALALQRWQGRHIECNNEVLEAKLCLASYLRIYGDLDGASALSEEVLTARSQVREVDEKQLLRAMEDRASSYARAGFFETAYSMSMEVLTRREELLGKLHKNTLDAMSFTAENLGGMGRKAEQEKMLLVVLDRSKQSRGDIHPETLFHLIELARCLHSSGDCRRALTLYTEFIVFSYHFRDEEQYHYPCMQNTLTDVLRGCGDYHYFVEILQDAHCRLSSLQDTDYSVLLNILSSLVDQLEARGKRLGAIALAQEFQDSMQRKWGEGHSRNLFAMRRLVISLMKNNQWAEAQQKQERILETQSKPMGPYHLCIIEDKALLVLILGKRRKLQEAEILQREVVKSCTADVPMRWTSSTMHVLALILIARDAVDEGLSLHLRAAAMTGGEPGLDQSGDSSWCHRIVRSVIQNDNFEAAEDYTHKINAKCEQVLGPNDIRTLNVRRWLADILASRESSSISSGISSELSTEPERMVTYPGTGRPMKISKWRFRPLLHRTVIIRLPKSQSRQWEEVSIGSWE